MTGGRRALIVNGSPKRSRSTSEVLGRRLMEGLERRGVETELVQLHVCLTSDSGREGLLAAVERCDLLVLAFPLYVDSLPAPMIRMLELIAARRRDAAEPGHPQLAAIVNCGFPEARHNDTALRICRLFADQCGFEWAGGLALGGGEAISGRPLGAVGGMVRHIPAVLEEAAGALAAGRPIPDEAIRRMARPLVPGRLYTLFGSRRWRRDAKRHGVAGRLHDRPYEPHEGG
jgi:hypothetical protein